MWYLKSRPAENFEIASLPTTSPEDRSRLLSFVICGGGPTGVETAAEISDLVHEDLVRYVRNIRCPMRIVSKCMFSHIVPQALRPGSQDCDHPIKVRTFADGLITLLTWLYRDHILNTYSEKISEYAEKRFQREHVDVITNARYDCSFKERPRLTGSV
jgi:NADH dehydrogenase FAD-containing subunit